MREFSYLWTPTPPGLFEDAAWAAVYHARNDYLRLPIRIHSESERRSREPPRAVKQSDDLTEEDRNKLQRVYDALHKVMPLYANSFDRIGTIIFGFSLLERACQMAAVVLSRNQVPIIPWYERDGSLPRKIEYLLRCDLSWRPSDEYLWSDLRVLYELRNAFVHASGHIDAQSQYGAKVLASAERLGIGLSELGFFVTDPGVDSVVGTFLEPTEAILQSVSDIVASRKNQSSGQSE